MRKARKKGNEEKRKYIPGKNIYKVPNNSDKRKKNIVCAGFLKQGI